MNKFLTLVIVGFLTTATLQATDSQRETDLKVIFKATYLSSAAKESLEMFAMGVMSNSNKEMPPSEIVQNFGALLDKGKPEQLFASYDYLTDEEIAEYRKFIERPFQEKMIQNTASTTIMQIEAINKAFATILEEKGKEKNLTESNTNKIQEVTKADFDQKVMSSKIPVVIDVYSNNCPPCKMMESVLTELSQAHKGEVQFLKINCDQESELAKKFGITKLPTFLFFKPGQDEPSMQTVGFTPKTTFEKQLSEFLSKNDPSK